MNLPHIHVACAIIVQNGLILAAQRSELMSLPLKWEFPGGKIEEGETPLNCLHRELMEELGISVMVELQLPESSHTYDEFRITLYPFICRQLNGNITLHEHKSVSWVTLEDIWKLDWAEADYPVISAFEKSAYSIQQGDISG